MKLSFEEFITNVQEWAKDRGIYEHSNAYAQTLKAISEFGEVCDAIAKNRIDDLKDGLGDTVTCLINVAWFYKFELQENYLKRFEIIEKRKERETVSTILYGLSAFADGDMGDGGAGINSCISYINHLAELHNIDMEECYYLVWDVISKRKGKMIEGGVFVKEEDL